MQKLVEQAAFWNFLSALVWPSLLAFLLFYFRKSWSPIGARLGQILDGIFNKGDVNVEVGSFKLKASAAIPEIGKQVSELQSRIASLEARLENNFLEFAPPDDNDSNVRILWVDDFPSNNAFLIDRFISDGIDVTTVISTENAIDLLKKQEYSVIISDLGRIEKGTDNKFAGLDLIKSARQMGIKTPIAIFAGHRGMQNKATLLEAGAQGVFDSGVDVLKFVTEQTARSR